jgi:hypothetical protein
MSSYPIVLEDKFRIATPRTWHPQPLPFGTIPELFPLWFILPTTYWLVMIGSSVAQDSCARVPPVVSSSAVDDADYF